MKPTDYLKRPRRLDGDVPGAIRAESKRDVVDAIDQSPWIGRRQRGYRKAIHAIPVTGDMLQLIEVHSYQQIGARNLRWVGSAPDYCTHHYSLGRRHDSGVTAGRCRHHREILGAGPRQQDDGISYLELGLRGERFVDRDRSRRILRPRLRLEEQKSSEEREQHARKLAALTHPVCHWRDEYLRR